MSSRQEEKERRRRERLEREQAEKSTQARRKRLQMAFGGLLALLLVVGIGAVAIGAIGGGGGEGEAEAPKGGADIPAQQQADLKKAADAAGCKLVDPPNEGAGHEEKDFKASDYKSNPPTSGNHTPDWYQDGVYAAGDTPSLGKTVHPLEHGRILIQYKKGSSADVVAQLETLVSESEGGYHMLMFENATNMPFAVAATAWDHLVGCPTMNPKVFDALRAFRTEYIDKGPEVVP